MFPVSLSWLTAPAVFLSVIACAAPTSQLGTVSPEDIKAEQLKQQQLVIRSNIAEQQRIEDISYPMLRAAVPLCGDRLTLRSGVLVLNLQAYSSEYQAAARAVGFDDTLTVIGVTPGSAGDRAGIRTGDRIVGLMGQRAPSGRNAVRDFIARVAPGSGTQGGSLRLAIHRPGQDGAAAPSEVPITIPRDTVCAFSAVAVKNDALNAWADGQQVAVTTAMMRFAGTDDELSVVVAHEIAHNAMRHLDAKRKNSLFGAILGAVVDVAAASQGINTGGGFTKQGADAGAMSYSQDFEREADYVGLYILARSGRPYASSPNFWRRMAQESPGSITYASSHPSSAERFIRLERTVAEIEGKVAKGVPLLPETKSGKDTKKR
jgi:hypothetical protein